MALREGSAARLRDELLAEAICAVGRDTDEREVIVGLALLRRSTDRRGSRRVV